MDWNAIGVSVVECIPASYTAQPDEQHQPLAVVEFFDNL